MNVPAAIRREIIADPCAYCGDDATHVDHIVPLAKDGTGDRENLTASCRRCNEEKLDFTPDEWRAWREETGRPWPPVPIHVERWDRLAALAADLDEETAVAALQGWTTNLKART